MIYHIANFRFIGEDGSLGYRHGQDYSLSVRIGGEKDDVEIILPIKCLYSSIESFLRNWEIPDQLRMYMRVYYPVAEIKSKVEEDKPHRNLIAEIEDILAKAKAFEYHDFKNTYYVAPKMELANRLRVFRNDVLNGKYDN